MTIIRTENVCRVFQTGKMTVHALKNVNVSIQSGTLTMLRGRSGSGKTTLMNSLGALDRPTSGKVFFDDNELTAMSDIARDRFRGRDIGFVFQSVALISTMSALENVDFSLRVNRYDPKKRLERAQECLSLVGLGKRMTHRAHELSGGEQQRVAIARALAHDPAIIFADEPTGNLDSRNGGQILDLLFGLAEEGGKTLVTVTHDSSIAARGDRTLIIRDGVVADS